MEIAEIMALLDLADSLLATGTKIYNNAQGIADNSTALTDEEKAALVARIQAAKDSVTKWD